MHCTQAMARTGFSLFSAEKRALVAKDHTGETPGALLKILGQQWRALDAAAKLGFEERAAAAAAAVGMFQRPTQKITHEQRMAAVRSRAQVVKGVLSDSDIAALDEMYRCIKAEAYASADASGSEQLSHPALIGLRDSAHHTAFLHVDAKVDRQVPHILEKVLGTMRSVDRAHWGLLDPLSPAAPSVAEGEAGRAYVVPAQFPCRAAVVAASEIGARSCGPWSAGRLPGLTLELTLTAIACRPLQQH